MTIDDPEEIKLVEKFREIKSKRMRNGDPAVTREFSFPSQLDSDDKRHISVGLRISSDVPRLTSDEVRVDTAKMARGFAVTGRTSHTKPN